MRKILPLFLFLPALAWGQGSYPFCQILDRVDASPWEVHGSYVLESRVDEPGAGEFGSSSRPDAAGCTSNKGGFACQFLCHCISSPRSTV